MAICDLFELVILSFLWSRCHTRELRRKGYEPCLSCLRVWSRMNAQVDMIAWWSFFCCLLQYGVAWNTILLHRLTRGRFIWARRWELQRAAGFMEAGGARSGSAAHTKGNGDDDGSLKPLPPCCVKAKAGVPESGAKCHDTVVSGWFTEPRSRSGLFRTRFGATWECMVVFLWFWTSDRGWCVCAGKTSKVQYFNNPMWPGSFLSQSKH